jgi:hypothetical protein
MHAYGVAQVWVLCKSQETDYWTLKHDFLYSNCQHTSWQLGVLGNITIGNLGLFVSLSPEEMQDCMYIIQKGTSEESV